MRVCACLYIYLSPLFLSFSVQTAGPWSKFHGILSSKTMCRRGTKNMHRKRHNKLALRQCWGTRRSAGRRPLRPCQTVLEFGAWGVETINENCLFDLQDVSFSNSSRSQRALIFGVYTQIRCRIFQCLWSRSERATSDGRTTEARES